jgi:hypothetical protein
MKNTLQPSSIASLNNLEANYQISLKKGIMNNAKQNPSAARVSAATEIITCITEEVELFRKKTMRQPSMDIYDKAYVIYLVELISTFICDFEMDCIDNEDVVAVLDELTADTGFLPAFLEWANEQEYTAPNCECAAKILDEFCKYVLSK